MFGFHNPFHFFNLLVICSESPHQHFGIGSVSVKTRTEKRKALGILHLSESMHLQLFPCGRQQSGFMGALQGSGEAAV